MNNLALLIPKDSLHFNIDFEFSNNQNEASEIYKKHFLLYVKEVKLEDLKIDKKNKKKDYETEKSTKIVL